MLPGSKTRTCGSCPAPAGSSGRLQPPDKRFFLPFVCRYKSARCQVWVNQIVPNLPICLLLFPNSGWRWIQGHCGAAGQTRCRGERDTHCFILDLPSSSCLWSNYSNHKSSRNISKNLLLLTFAFFSCLKGHSEIVQILVGVCNLEALDDHNISPLFLAAQYGRQECLEILVNAGEYVIPLRDRFHSSSHAPATFSFTQKLIVWFDSHIFRRQCKHAGGGSGHAAAHRLSRGSSELCRIPSGPRSRSKCRLQPWLAPTCHSCCCWVWTHWVPIRRVWTSGIFIPVSLLLLKWFSHYHLTQQQSPLFSLSFYLKLQLRLICFISSVLKRLIAATDRVCDQGDGMVSPLYVAVNRHQSGSMRALLSEGYSPDAQDCTHVLGLRSPLSLALSHTSDGPCRLWDSGYDII